MARSSLPEYGITHAVRTCTSRVMLAHVMNSVISTKARAVAAWLADRGREPRNALIIGTYLTGAGIANRLIGKCPVTVLDVHPHLNCLLHPGVSFTTSLEEVTGRTWDFVIDTSGIGGISPEDIHRLPRCRTFVTEDPASDGSDTMIRQVRQCWERAGSILAEEKGILRTGGLAAKTSGTMTLSMGVLRHAMAAAHRQEGVLYCTAPMEFSERILFGDRDPARFFESLERPALTVSSLTDVDCDALVWGTLERLKSYVAGVRGGDMLEGNDIVQKCGGNHPLGSVVGGRSGWFYRPGRR
ncbi:DUF1188 domain-containing protein [Methanoregula sp.]|uniref:DUF1188 domain-containing protein n=1 Tax=Methanoregula sp. TaxID=2052170 RepID=UPI002608A647|nr:DUF1188 domain-containing protein [Methanoregula sp.]MDD5143605.1 DUF1188 domain-containing protein [Methanoregula sp.]